MSDILSPDVHSVSEPDTTSLEEYLASYIALKQQAEDNKFLQGQLLDAMISMGAKVSWLSSQTGDSPAQIRELVKVYRAFPEEGMRVPELSWYHHRLAANTDDPQKWISKAADEHLSTRQLRELILIEQGRQEQISAEKEKLIAKAKKHIKALQEIAERNADVKWEIKSMIYEFINTVLS